MGSVLRYIRKAPRIAAAFVTEPMETWTRLYAKFANFGSSRKPRCSYVVDPDWDCRLHEMLGAPWPCREAAEFWTLWPEVIEALTAQGMRIGPASFGVWNDGEPELVRAVWCLTRHLRPTKVVETGVARGLTSRFILEALEKNKTGHLWSVDLPPLLEPQLHAQIGAAVGNRFANRWSYIKGSSRRRLPGLLSKLGQINLFIHDSVHTDRNVRFELEHGYNALTPGGAIVVDDIDLNWGFHTFRQAFPDQRSFVCQARPITPDLRRFDGKGLFGIACKEVRPQSPPRPER
jgi:hypothetical protein